MTDENETIKALRGELEAAFRNRADLYRLTLDELASRFGAAMAEEILTRIVERRGREVAIAAFSRFGANDACAIGEAFLKASPDSGRMYPATVERGAHHIAFRVARCPLKDAWLDAGVDEPALAGLCRIAGAFDRGLFEATGVHFANTTWTPGHGSDCCHIRLTDRDFVEEGPAGSTP